METKRARRRLWGILAVTLFVLVVGWTVRQTARAPVRNWDMLCYMALALEWGEDDPVEVHRATYAHAEEGLPPRVYRGMLDGGWQVRRARYQDPAAFTEHLAFYRARILYTLPLWLIHQAGAPLVATTWWMSLLSWAALAGLVLLWAARYLPLWGAALLALAVSHVPPVLEAARFSTPDALTTLVTCAGVYLLAVRRSLPLAALVLTGSLLVRPDNVILIVLLIAALVLLDDREERPTLRFAALWFGASVLVYLVLQRWSGHYGWWPVFWITMIQKEVYPSQIPTTMNLEQYWVAFKLRSLRALKGAEVYYAATYTLAALAALTQYLRAGRPAPIGRHAAILIALLATFLVRFPLFPQLWSRFLAPLYVLVPLLLLSMWMEARQSQPAEE